MKNRPWQRPFTAKRYLHPPLAESLFTLWPDFRLMCGDIVEVPHQKYTSAAFRLLVAPGGEPVDFRQARQITRDDGVPVHSLEALLEDYTLRMEAFCDVRRLPAAYSRVEVHNPHPYPVEGRLLLLARTGDERELTGMEVDGYAHYSNEVRNWGFLSNGYAWDGEVLGDGEYQLRLQGLEGFAPSWQGDEPGTPWHLRHLLALTFRLAPGESRCFDAAFRHGEAPPFAYEEQKAQTETFWQEELGRMQDPPPAADKIQPAVVRNLVAQCLQMFCRPKGKEYVYPRQGGMQRGIWPVEALEFLIALDRLGGYTHYTGTAYSLFFEVMQQKDGEDAGQVCNLPGYQNWAGITGGALWGLARHLLFLRDNQVFQRYRASALLAFEWLARKRAQTLPGAIPGIFPPMQASDWGDTEYQAWCQTDSVSLTAMRWLAKAFAWYDDPAAERIQREHDDYMACMQGILQQELENNTREGEIIITNRAGVPMPDPPQGPYMTDGPAMLLRAGVLEAGSEAARLCENYFRNRGMMQRGLTGLMNDGLLRQGHNSDPWAGHTWYTSAPDLCWFEHWLRQGERDKARETLEAQFRYAMTSEYQMNERYADNDPYFVPWLPNASANGRTLMMLYGWHNGEYQL